MPRSTGPQYSIDIGGINGPASLEGAGAASQRAGAAAGQAETIADQANAGALSFLGTSALEAGKGYLISQQSKEIEDVAKHWLDERAENIPAKVGNFSQEQAQKLVDAGVTDPAVQSFAAEAKKLQAGIQQGVLSRDQALLRMSAITRKYVAMMPGWAPEFRQAAAAATGISNLDVWGIHQAMSAEGRRQAQKDAYLEMQQKQDFAIMQANGYSHPGQITTKDRMRFQEAAQRQLQLKQLEDQNKLTELTDAQRTELYGQQVLVHQQEAVAAIQEQLAVYRQANNGKTPKTKEEADALALQVNQTLSSQEQGLASRIRSMGIRSESNPFPLKGSEVQRLLDNNQKMFDQMRESVKSEAGMNLFMSSVATNEASATDMMNRWNLAHPWMMTAGKLGIAPAIAELYFNVKGDRTALAKTLGSEAAADAVIRVFEDAGSAENAARQVEAVQTGKLTLAEAEKAYGPDAVKMLNTAGDVQLKKMSEAVEAGETLSAEQQNTVTNLVKNLSQLNLTSETDRAQLRRRLTDGTLLRLYDSLPPEKKVEAFAPLVERIARSAPDMANQLEGLAAEQRASLVVDRVTGRVALQTGPDVRPDKHLLSAVDNYNANLYFLEKAAGALPPGLVNGDVRQMFLGTLQQAAQNRVDRIQSAADAITKNQALVAEQDKGRPGARPVQQSRFAALEEAKAQAERLKVELFPTPQAGMTAGDVRRFDQGQTPASPAQARGAVSPGAARAAENASMKKLADWESTIRDLGTASVPGDMLVRQLHAESGGDPKATSAKGAAGLMQIMPETQQDIERLLGRKIDPRNPRDAVEGGAAYMKWISARPAVSGNIFKALAAYNWGIGNLERHGIDDAPKETRRYVRSITGVDLWPEKDVGNKVGGGREWTPDPQPWAEPWVERTMREASGRDYNPGTTSTTGVRG